MNEGAHTPMYTDTDTPLTIVDSNVVSTHSHIDKDDASSLATEMHGKMTPRCWRTLYHLLDLYSTMPDSKTVTHR